MKASNSKKDPIHFASKKEEFESLHHSYNKNGKVRFHSISDNSHKVLEYPSKAKKGAKKLKALKNKVQLFFNKHRFLKLVTSALLILSILVIIDRVFYK